jgi:peptidoglycan/LPS O-acetylase OafA/YrhL
MLTNIGFVSVDIFNDPSWSISVEFLVSVFILYFFITKNWISLALIFVFLSYALLFFYDGFRLRQWNLVGFGVNGGMLRGLGGILLGYILYSKFTFTLKNVGYIGCILLLLLIVLLFDPNSDGSYDVLGLFMFFILVAILRSGDSIVRTICSNPMFVFLGNISFSLYLTHTSLILFLAPGDWIFLFGNFTSLFVFGLMILVATIVTYGFEKPVNRWLYSFT